MGINGGLKQHSEQEVFWDSSNTLTTRNCLNRLKEVRHAMEMVPEWYREREGLCLWFSNFTVCENDLEYLLIMQMHRFYSKRFWFGNEEVGLGSCIYKKHPRWMWCRWYKYHILSITSWPSSQLSIYSVITGNSLVGTERRNTVPGSRILQYS